MRKSGPASLAFVNTFAFLGCFLSSFLAGFLSSFLACCATVLDRDTSIPISKRHKTRLGFMEHLEGRVSYFFVGREPVGHQVGWIQIKVLRYECQTISAESCCLGR